MCCANNAAEREMAMDRGHAAAEQPSAMEPKQPMDLRSSQVHSQQLPKLDDRLARVLQLMPHQIGKLIDVGTDHGLLLLHALREKQVDQIVAMDLRDQPLERARKNLTRFGLSERAVFLLRDGLGDEMAGPGDVIVIAGMGGLEIRDILSEATGVRAGALAILQPMKSTKELRLALPGIGWTVVSEQLASSRGRYYPLIIARAGTGISGSVAWRTAESGVPDRGSQDHWATGGSQDHRTDGRLREHRATGGTPSSNMTPAHALAGGLLLDVDQQDELTRAVYPAFLDKQIERFTDLAAVDPDDQDKSKALQILKEAREQLEGGAR